MPNKILVGTSLYGYCGGHFGRDSYGQKRVEGIGVDWVVVREVDSGMVHLATGEQVHEDLLQCTQDDELDG